MRSPGPDQKFAVERQKREKKASQQSSNLDQGVTESQSVGDMGSVRSATKKEIAEKRRQHAEEERREQLRLEVNGEMRRVQKVLAQLEAIEEGKRKAAARRLKREVDRVAYGEKLKLNANHIQRCWRGLQGRQKFWRRLAAGSKIANWLKRKKQQRLLLGAARCVVVLRISALVENWVTDVVSETVATLKAYGTAGCLRNAKAAIVITRWMKRKVTYLKAKRAVAGIRIVYFMRRRKQKRGVSGNQRFSRGTNSRKTSQAGGTRKTFVQTSAGGTRLAAAISFHHSSSGTFTLGKHRGSTVETNSRASDYQRHGSVAYANDADDDVNANIRRSHSAYTRDNSAHGKERSSYHSLGVEGDVTVNVVKDRDKRAMSIAEDEKVLEEKRVHALEIHAHFQKEYEEGMVKLQGNIEKERKRKEQEREAALAAEEEERQKAEARLQKIEIESQQRLENARAYAKRKADADAKAKLKAEQEEEALRQAKEADRVAKILKEEQRRKERHELVDKRRGRKKVEQQLERERELEAERVRKAELAAKAEQLRLVTKQRLNATRAQQQQQQLQLQHDTRGGAGGKAVRSQRASSFHSETVLGGVSEDLPAESIEQAKNAAQTAANTQKNAGLQRTNTQRRSSFGDLETAKRLTLKLNNGEGLSNSEKLVLFGDANTSANFTMSMGGAEESGTQPLVFLQSGGLRLSGKDRYGVNAIASTVGRGGEGAVRNEPLQHEGFKPLGVNGQQSNSSASDAEFDKFSDSEDIDPLSLQPLREDQAQVRNSSVNSGSVLPHVTSTERKGSVDVAKVTTTAKKRHSSKTEISSRRSSSGAKEGVKNKKNSNPSLPKVDAKRGSVDAPNTYSTTSSSASTFPTIVSAASSHSNGQAKERAPVFYAAEDHFPDDFIDVDEKLLVL